MEQIIIVEDDRVLGEGLCKALKTEDRKIILCDTIESARMQLLCGSPSLMILDINLPDGNGLDYLKELRVGNSDNEQKIGFEESKAHATGFAGPVILLTANDTDMDIVSGLENGADDYITKPFSLAVLRARVNTQLRAKATTQHFNGQNSKAIYIDKYIFDFERMEYTCDGEVIELSKTEQKLLKLLVDNSETTLTRNTLIDRVWTDGAEYVDENALSVSIKRLRDKLQASDYIKTVYGIGYVWKSKAESGCEAESSSKPESSRKLGLSKKEEIE